MTKPDGKPKPVVIPAVVANDLEIVIGKRMVVSDLPIPTHELLSAAQRAALFEAHLSMGERCNL